MSENTKKAFDKHTKSMAELINLSNQLNNVQVSNADNKKEIELTPQGIPSMYQGDIILTEQQASYLIDEAKLKIEAKKSNKTGSDVDKEIVEKLKKNRAYKKDSPFKWTFPIPYFIEGGVDQNVVDQALKTMEKETCITFKKTAPFNNKLGLKIFKGKGCWSFVGPTYKDKPQEISIGNNCEKNGIVQDEVSHALGMFHEQSRPDRDNYLSVNLNNVDSNLRDNFDKSTIAETDTFGVPYDYGSVMHYGKKAFSSNRGLTMVPKNKDYLNTIGNNEKMQFNDIKTINLAFCSGRCKGGVQCSNGGYENPMKCGTCKCPSMFEGDTCNKVRKNPANCGQSNSIVASNAFKSLKLQGVKDCVFLISATDGKKPEIVIERGNLKATERCFPGVALEVKYSKDLTITGLTFCGSVHNKKILLKDLNCFSIILVHAEIILCNLNIVQFN
ncbi:Astacin-like metalloendopeptidase [Strongyloides ratti]|uniref:Zinc metalloproteinase n=1 Tax=Strongyloides ratti TaxID=34506 RepID=A0A090KVA5_STRRB|nr:Astacin-like metalloendopeptidase [Strongyloides ratti]CEF61450.1 Astacin-like metalloendopeptidase [Strongyloides ratti]